MVPFDRRQVELVDVTVEPSLPDVATLSIDFADDAVTEDSTARLHGRFHWAGENCTLQVNDHFPINHPLESHPEETPGLVLLEPETYDRREANRWVPDTSSLGHSLAVVHRSLPRDTTLENDAELWVNPRFSDRTDFAPGQYRFRDAITLERGDSTEEHYQWWLTLDISPR